MTDQQHIKNLEAIAMSLASELALLRQQREPKACEHYWVSSVLNNGANLVACNYCGEKKPEPPKPKMVKSNHTYLPDEYGDCVICGRARHETEPPKPERVAAREWWIRYPKLDDTTSCVPEVWPDRKQHQVVFPNDEWIKVREILPGDDK